MHGIGLNVNPTLESFSLERIIPCGISDAGVTSISEQLGRTVTPADILEPLEAELLKYQDRLADSFEPIAAQD